MSHKGALWSSLAVFLATGIVLSVGAGPAIAATTPTTPTATTGAVTSVLPSSAVVTGTVNPNGAATTWYFQFGTSTSYGSKTPVNSAGSGTADVPVSGTLGGLTPATSYHYRVVATSALGTTEGADGNFSTSATPQALTGAAGSIAASSATLNGVVNTEGQATKWYFQFGTTTTYGSKTPLKSLTAGPNSVEVSAAISSLAPRTTYYFRIVVTSSAGTTYGTDLALTTGLSVTLNASTPALIYGQFVTLSGTVASGAAAVHVTLVGEPFDQTTFSGVADIVTGTGGTWSYRVQPTARTTFEATANGGTSSPAVVGVSPVVYLSVLSAGNLSARVVGAMSFGSHIVQLQRLAHNRWVTQKLLRLGANEKSTFSATLLPTGQSTIRIAIGSSITGINQAGPGYLAGYSRAASYHRP